MIHTEGFIMAKEKKENNRFKNTFLKIMITGLAAICGLVLVYVVAVIISASTQEIDVDGYISNYSGQIYYFNEEKGNYEELDRIYAKEKKIWVPILEMPEHLIEATIAIEDERFKEHNGVDWKRTIGATLTYMFNKDTGYGGSTITQQLIKNLTGQDDRSVPRKIKEIWNSMRLERKLSKDQIMELYLNTIYLSQGCNGVGAAAKIYFDKEASELSVAESAAIIGITQYPTRYDPFLNPEKNKEKQELVLKKMKELGYLNEEEYTDAVNEELKFDKGNAAGNADYNTYFVDQVITDVAKDLEKEKKYDYETALKMIHSGGLKIYATIDPKIQKAMDEVYEDKNNFGTKGEQSSMVIVDPYTGEVKAMAGGVGKKPGDFVLNRATMSPRQPGSSIKPISVYGPAVEAGIINPMTVIADEKITIAGWSPVNYYSGFKGNMSVLQAVKLSTNTVAVKVLQELGVEKSYKFLSEKLGITTLVSKEVKNGKVVSDKNLPALALGGLTNGITTYEMAAAYGAFVNGGVYMQPHTYTKVMDSNGHTILENKSKGIVAMKKETAQIMCQMLSAVTSAGGTGVAAALPNVATAGKTGTTDDNKDRWFVGFTPYYVGAVWYGYDTPKNMSYLTSNPALKAWKMVMSKVHSSLPYKAFPGVTATVDVSVCGVSGKLYTPNCLDADGNSTEEIKSFKYHEVPTEQCDESYHIHEEVNEESNEENNNPDDSSNTDENNKENDLTSEYKPIEVE